jgi:hypothetical protein
MRSSFTTVGAVGSPEGVLVVAESAQRFQRVIGPWPIT